MMSASICSGSGSANPRSTKEGTSARTRTQPPIDPARPTSVQIADMLPSQFERRDTPAARRSQAPMKMVRLIARDELPQFHLDRPRDHASKQAPSKRSGKN